MVSQYPSDGKGLIHFFARSPWWVQLWLPQMLVMAAINLSYRLLTMHLMMVEHDLYQDAMHLIRREL